MPIIAASSTKAVTREIGRKGLSSISLVQQRELALDQALSRELNKSLNEEIKTSHCDLLPQSMIPAMSFVQRYRDANFARAMVDAAKRDTLDRAILIAGNWSCQKLIARCHGIFHAKIKVHGLPV